MNKYLKKQLKNRDNKLKYDFLPSMIEIIERPANRICMIIMYVIIALITTTILWSSFAKLDITVIATGVVDTENALITLNSLVDGTISEVKVNDGECVKKGDVICILESNVSDATLKEYEYNLEVLNIQKTVYEEVYTKYKNDDYTSLDIDISTYGKNSRIAEAIVMENDVFIKSLESLENEEIETARSRQLLSVTQNLNNIDAKIKSVSAELKAGKKELSDKTIVATETGVYSSQNKLYAGKVITAGEVLGYISCDKNEYKFTAYVSDKDITKLKIGDTVKIKIAALDDTKYEYINGEIVQMGDVPVNIENKGVSYVVNIKLHIIPDNVKLGMEGNIDIIVGKRTVMDYFLDPFKKGLDDSLKER